MVNINQKMNSFLDGAIEMHVHFGPDAISERKQDVFELLREAKEVGIKAVVLKNKCFGTGGIAQIANKYSGGAKAIGAIALDTTVGGFNPEAVAIEAELGSKVVWMPTFSAKNDPTYEIGKKGLKLNSLEITANNGDLQKEIYEILNIIKKRDMVLATGHISRDEVFRLTDEAVSMGIKKLIITHPLTKSVGTMLNIEDQIALSKMGAYIELSWCSAMPKNGGLHPSVYVETIRTIGADKCILATDFGQIHNPTMGEGFSMMIHTLLKEGITEKEIEVMVKQNPSFLLDL